MYMLRVYRYRELLLAEVVSEILARYKQSLMGPMWALFQPLVLMVIFTLVRSLVGIESDGIPYPTFVYAALVPWAFFANSITYGTPKIVQRRSLILKVYFPREILPITGVLTALVDFGLAFPILIGLMVYYQVGPGVAILLFPVLLLIQMTLVLGIVFVLSPLAVYRRDITIAAPLIVQFWMFLCPVVYPLSAVPGQYQILYLLNPMAGLVEAWRQILIVGELPEARLIFS